MNHREIDRLEDGDPPAVDLRVEQDGVYVQVRVGVADPSALSLLPGFWLDGPEPVFQDCKQALQGILPEVYAGALTIHGLFEKALTQAVAVRGDPLGRFAEAVFAEVTQAEGDIKRV